MNERESIIIQQTVVSTLQMLGIESGYVSWSKGRRLWGKAFTEMVRRGDIKPVMVGEGKNGTKTFAIRQILEKLA